MYGTEEHVVRFRKFHSTNFILRWTASEFSETCMNWAELGWVHKLTDFLLQTWIRKFVLMICLVVIVCAHPHHVPAYRLLTVGRRSFPVAASILRTSMPPVIQSSSFLTNFCHRLNTYTYSSNHSQTFCCNCPQSTYLVFLVPPSGTTCLSTSHLRRHSRFSDNDSRPFCFPFLPRHYHMTRVLLSPFITTVWTPVVLAIINI